MLCQIMLGQTVFNKSHAVSFLLSATSSKCLQMTPPQMLTEITGFPLQMQQNYHQDLEINPPINLKLFASLHLPAHVLLL